MNPNLNTNRKPPPTHLLNRPDHIPDHLALVHQGRAQAVGARPALRTAAVEVDAVAVRLHQGRGAGEFEGRAGGELGDERAVGGVGCEVCVGGWGRGVSGGGWVVGGEGRKRTGVAGERRAVEFFG